MANAKKNLGVYRRHFCKNPALNQIGKERGKYYVPIGIDLSFILSYTVQICCIYLCHTNINTQGVAPLVLLCLMLDC